MNCRKCGRPMNEKAQFCPGCGNINGRYGDDGGLGWGVLGFCIPIVGIVLFLIWMDERPNAAKYAGLGALIGFISAVLIRLIIIR